MSKIATLTFSPCIDKSVTIPQLVPAKKLQCSGVQQHPGGGGINAARVIKRLGGSVTAIFPAGGSTGRKLAAMLKKEVVDIKPVEEDSETRENIMVFEHTTGHQYRLGMPANTLSSSTCTALLKELELIDGLEFIVVSGSIPADAPAGLFSKIAGIARSKTARLIIDSSDQALVDALKYSPFLIKPNLGELAKLTGNNYLNLHDIPRAARKIIAENHCEAVVVSMGEAGAMLVTANIIQTLQAPLVTTISTVGAGDSMVGGIVYALSQGQSLENATKLGVACGTAATLSPGTKLCSMENAIKLSKQVLSAYTLQPVD